MGIFDRFRKKKSAKELEAEATYVLVRRVPSGGMKKVMALKEPATIDELYEHLEPGFYALHKYKKGQSGFESLWENEVLGEPKPKAEAAEGGGGSPFSGLRKWATDMKSARDDIVSVMEILGPMAGFTKAGDGTGVATEKPKSLLDEIREAKAQQKDLNEFFPLANTGTQNIPISGTVPAALVYAPQVVDQALDAVEKRMKRWGVIEEAGEAKQEDVIHMPEKPKTVKEETTEEKVEEKGEETEEVEEEEEGIKMPERPEVLGSASEEIGVKRLEDIEKEGKGDGGKGKSKPAK